MIYENTIKVALAKNFLKIKKKIYFFKKNTGTLF